VGSRLPAGARGERQLSLRFRLLAAAAGIVATSLLLSGALTWFLVRNVELQAAQDSVDRSVQVSAMLVRHQECLTRTGVATNAGAATCRLTDGNDFSDRLNSSVVPTLGGARLLLLGRQRQVLYDSQDPANTGIIDITASKRVANVAEAQPVFGGERYLAAAMVIAPARDPLSAAYVVVARPESAVTTAAAGELVPRLLVAGGAALMVALVLVLIVLFGGAQGHGKPKKSASAKIAFSHEHGFYEEPFSLALTSSLPAAAICYTTNGSAPSTSSQHYEKPVRIDTTTVLRAATVKDGEIAGPIETRSYIFPRQVLKQTGAGFPQTWGIKHGVPVAADYEMDPEIVNHPDYKGALENALKLFQ